MPFFPSSVPTTLDLLQAKNNTKVILDGNINDVITTIPVIDTTDIPAAGYLTFEDGTNEIIQYTGKTLTTLTGVIRGADNTTASSHANGVGIGIWWIAKHHNILAEEINGICQNLSDRIGLHTTRIILQDYLDANSKKISNLAAGSVAGDALRYEQLVGVYLPLSGGTMVGNIAMSGTQKLTGLAAGSTAGDSVRYEQVLLLSGGTMSGNIAMGSNKITGLANATGTGEAITFNQLAGTGAGAGASLVGIQDTLNRYDATTVETALSEIAVRLDILRPQPQTVPTNTVYVQPGHLVKSNGQGSINFAGGSSPTFAVVTANSRIDLLTIDDTGTLAVVQGTQALSPVAPTYPSTSQVIAEVTIDETTTVVINTADIRDVRYFLNLGGGGAVFYVNRMVVGTAVAPYTGSTTVFDLDFSYNQDGKSLFVYVDGVLMSVGASNDYQETLTNRVTFNNALVAGQVVECRAIVSAAPATQFFEYRENYVLGTALNNYTGSLTVIDLVQPYVANGVNVTVTLDGVVMTPGQDYTETSSTRITFIRSTSTSQKVSLIFKKAAAAYNAQTVNGISANTSPTANQLLPLNGNSQFPLGAGTVSLPSLALGNTTTGLYRGASGGNYLGMTVDGTLICYAHATQGLVMNMGQILGNDGTAASPSHSFWNGTSTGLYRSTNQLNIAVNGVQVGHFVDNGSSHYGLRMSDGVVGDPAYTFISDGNTGMFRAAEDNLQFACGGITSVSMYDSADIGGSELAIAVYSKVQGGVRQFLVGATDSGGTGYRMVRVANA